MWLVTWAGEFGDGWDAICYSMDKAVAEAEAERLSREGDQRHEGTYSVWECPEVAHS